MTPRKPAPPAEPTDRQRLEQLRDTLTAAIATAREAGPDKQAQIAPLAKQLRDTLDAIAKLPQAQKSARDEIAERRKARLAGAAAPTSASRKVVSRAGSDRASGKRRADSGSVAAARPRRRAGGSA